LTSCTRRHGLASSAAASAESSDFMPDGAHNPHRIRNLAICAHVDHGKTTLCDKILRACEVALTATDDRVMDSNDMERERGITIMSKVTTVMHRDALINVVDSPGHGDFGAEVERVLGMVDSTVLLVDATEGPMAQTKFVLSKALALKHRPLVVINKVDRDTARPEEVESEVFDLFASLDASDDQLDFTTLYASARDGWVSHTPTGGREHGMTPLLDKIIEVVPPPKVSMKEPFAFVVTLLSRDPFLGRTATGRVCAGYAQVGDTVHVVSRDGQRRRNAKITRIMASRGLQPKEIPVAGAGDIVSLSGIEDMCVSDTIGFPPSTASTADCNNLSTPTIKPIWTPAIDPPTVAINFCVNDSPLAGKDGIVLTTQKLTDWLRSEAENNVSIHVADEKSEESLEVKGRGELQLGIVIEKLRREGYELAVSPPRVLTRLSEDGSILEPVEELTVEVDEEHSGSIIDKLSARQADFLGMKPSLGNRVRLSFLAPSRGLLGYRPIFTQDTRGTGIMNRVFAEWASPRGGLVISGRKGAVISMADGLTAGFALAALEARGTLFVGAREPVYTGMIIGESSRDMDIDVNPVKGKQLTNIRTHSKDELIRLSPPRTFTLESAISYISDDELVEVTPKTVRMRKRELDANKRIRNKKKKQQ
jgi:GTP-binding protein